MEPDEVTKAVNDGSIYNASPEKLREMLAATTHISGHYPTLVHQMNQAAELIRHLLRSNETDQQLATASATALEQHNAVFGVGTRTLRWTIVAAVAAIIGAIAAIVAVFR